MSWNITINKVETTGLLERNVTYNVSPMFYKAFGGDGIKGFRGMSGKEALPFLVRGLDHMLRNKDEYEAMNPDNGWGSYSGAVELLQEMITACKTYDNTTIEIN